MRRAAGIVFHAPLGTTEAERLVEHGRRAIAVDLVAALRDSGADIVLVVTSEEAGRAFPSEDVVVPAPPDAPFDFGATLKRLIRQHDLDGFLYFGSGSGALLLPQQIRQLLSFAAREEDGAVFNNFYSCDFAAIAGAERLLEIELPTFDNPLGFAIANTAIPCFSLPRCAETQFDVDTPTDLLLLAETDVGGAETRAFLSRTRLSHPFLPDVLRLLTDRSAHVYLLGRVNPGSWAHFEREVACRTSGLIEGRGMRGYGVSRALPLHQALKEQAGSTLFDQLSQSADAALIDSRPLLSVRGTLPPASDRFASDLLRPETIEDRTWREFTEAAARSPIPVVVGGHSLVSGGLYLIAQACWKGRELPRRLHPESFDWERN